MRLGLLISYYHSGHASLAMLRLLIDSIRQHLSRDAYGPLLIVDDCSPEAPEWNAYGQWLVGALGATVYRLGPPRLPFVHRGPDGTVRRGHPPETSYGHAIGIMAGFAKLRELGCTHAWVIDADCVLMNDCDLARALSLFHYPKVAVVTDYYAGRPESGVDLVCDEDDERRYIDGAEAWRSGRWERPVKNAQHLAGFPVLFCGIVDLGVEERFGGMANRGWVNSRWGQRLFRQGYRVAYFPFFQGRHVFHLGYGLTRHNARVMARTYGNVLETSRYGGKGNGVYHAGYLQLAESSTDFEAWLAKTSTETPYDGTIALARARVVDPPMIPMHGRQEHYIRAFLESDFDALREIDSDPICTRFLSWGPHGEDATRRFLSAACSDRRRWFALVDHAKLVGYGELRPLEPLNGARTAGLSYVVRRSEWGRGLGKLLVKELYEIGVGPLDHECLMARIDVENAASLGALRASSPDWEERDEETYALKGVPRRRRTYVRWVMNRESSDQASDRERLLFEVMGLWR